MKIWTSPKSVILVFLLTVFISCNKVKNEQYNENADNMQQIFIQFWDKMNTQYVYWDKEQTNWELLYKEFKPRFDQLSNSDSDKKKAVTYFRQMCSELLDNHLIITFNNGVLKQSSINPSYERKAKKKNFHERFNYDDIVKSYLDDGFLAGRGHIVENGISISSTVGTINNSLLYFHCNFFSLNKSYNSDTGDIKLILDYFFCRLKGECFPIKGIILDLRNNAGGSVVDMNFFAGKLVNNDVTFGYTRSKTGLGKLSYQPWLTSVLKHDAGYNVDVPIVLLIDNFSASLAEIMVIALKSKKNITIGENTYGATGAISDSEIFNSGSFNIGDFLTVKTSSVEFKGIDGLFYENVGIAPDIYVPFNAEELNAGKDAQLESAIKLLQ
jgi:carboxyl-terminal processing protease